MKKSDCRNPVKRKTAKQNTKESAVVKEILTAFKDDPEYILFRRNVGAMKPIRRDGTQGFIKFAEVGQSDIYGYMIGSGTHLEIECKNEIGELSAAQEKWIDTVNATGGIAIVVRPDRDKGLVGIRKWIVDEIQAIRIKRIVEKQPIVVKPSNPTKLQTVSVEDYKRMIQK